MDDNNIIFFGHTSFRAQKKKFGIKQDDRRRHFYTIGKTGMGKSNLMENMAIQDIQAGHGLAYIDPHGEGAEKLLDFIPEERINDVVFFNPADLDFPIAFNVMEKVDFKYRHLVANGLMGVFKKVWPDVWSARMEYILNNCILALLEYPDSTLLGVNRMLADPDYRAEVVSKVQDPVVRAFWVTEYARYSQKYETEATAAIQNKVGQFLSNALIRNVLGQTNSTINMRKIMDEEKIFILDLSKGRIGEENSRLLGALLITKLQLAAMSRVDIPEDQRKDFYLYVDEFQNFATESFANILSEARKYRLCLILGHQYISQMDEIVRDAVFGNVGTLVTFRVGAEDAEWLEKEFTPDFAATDLVNLAKYNVYLKLMIDGVASQPFSASTLPPPKPLEESNREKIIAASRERYSVARDVVENNISSWIGGGDKLETLLNANKATSTAAAKISAPMNQEGQVTLYDATCSNCGKPTKTIFQPEAGRPVYCKNCLKKIKAAKAEATAEVSVPAAAPKSAAIVHPAPVPAAKPQVQAPRPASVSLPKPEEKKAPAQASIKTSPAKDADAVKPASTQGSGVARSEKIENVSFSSRRKEERFMGNPQAKPKRKEINLSELRKALEVSLASAQEEKEAKEKSAAADSPTSKEEKARDEKPASVKDAGVAKPASAENSSGVAKKGIINPGEKVSF